jgi:hypothetical protein
MGRFRPSFPSTIACDVQGKPRRVYCKAQARKVSLVLVMNGCEAIETCKLSVGVKACVPSTQPWAHALMRVPYRLIRGKSVLGVPPTSPKSTLFVSGTRFCLEHYRIRFCLKY